MAATSRFRRISVVATLLIVLSTASSIAHAQYSWHDDSNGDWIASGNWMGGMAPPGTAADALTFGSDAMSSYMANIDPTHNPWIANSITFKDGAATISGEIDNSNASGLLLAGTNPQITQQGAGVDAFTTPVVLGGDTTIDGSGTGTLTFGAAITEQSSRASIAIASPNATVNFFNGGDKTKLDSTYSGGTTISAGTVVLGSSSFNSQSGAIAGGPLGTGRITIGGDSAANLIFTSSANGVTSALIISNPITVSSDSMGTVTLGAQSGDVGIFAGNITLGSTVNTGKSIVLTSPNG
ncbi:MAG TPA: hypothetical protein VG056_08630, partial [Pirellulales bacterium]|nr:hypothetical protein [Pirellulales bacterium]